MYNKQTNANWFQMFKISTLSPGWLKNMCLPMYTFEAVLWTSRGYKTVLNVNSFNFNWKKIQMWVK